MTTTKRRRLPLATEQTLSQVKHLRTKMAGELEIEVRTSKQMTCKKGCSNCCYHPVLITALEGALLYQGLVRKGKWSSHLRTRLEEHMNKTKDLAFEVWFLSVIPCPLLNETTKECTAYAVRPYQCRATYSIGEAADCHPHNIAKSGLLNRQKTMAEYHSEHSKLISKHGLQMVLMPLSMAVLLGEDIIAGRVPLENADREVLRKFGDV